MVIGYAYVVADLIHIGHLKHLKKCASLCDRLIVGVLTEMACMEKKSAPIIPFNERMEMIDGLECVDGVTEQYTYSPLLNVSNLKIDVLFESESHTKEAIAHARKVVKVVVLPYYEAQSSTKIKNKIKNES